MLSELRHDVKFDSCGESMRHRVRVVSVVDDLNHSSVCCWVVFHLKDEEDLKMIADTAEQAVD